MKQPADVASSGYCEHPSARHIKLYLPYADANVIRVRTSQGPESQGAHVSWLYEIPGGWGWTICRECRARDARSA